MNVLDRPTFALFRHFALRLKTHFLRSVTEEDARAEELAQEAMLLAWWKAPLFGPDWAAASSWVLRGRAACMRAAGGLVRQRPDPLLRLALSPLFARGHDDAARRRESFDVHFANYARHDGAEALVRQVRSLDVRDTLAVADRLPALGVPARIVWSAADPFQKLVYGERFACDMKAPLRRIDEGGRHFTLEDHPDVVAEEIDHLLAEVRAVQAAAGR